MNTITDIDSNACIVPKGISHAGNDGSRYLAIVHNYPSSDRLYGGGFIHRRTCQYRQEGLDVEVFCISNETSMIRDMFEGVPVIKGNLDVLGKLLLGTCYRKILVHGVTHDIIKVLDASVPTTAIIVWIHGMETESWTRRLFDFNWSLRQLFRLPRTIRHSNRRLQFMRSLYENTESERDIEFVFVSRWFKNEVAEKDARCHVKNSHVIPNVIDDAVFDYLPKPTYQRGRILTIRSFQSRKYGNDLSVKAIMKLSRYSHFSDMQFLIVGDGRLFTKTLKPLRSFANIQIRQQFLTQQEIAKLHKEYGIFLCPTRLDAQGVSMCEAMSSGLVPVTNEVTAIPEYVTKNEGVLGRRDDYRDLAQGIIHLYENPAVFERKSAEAAHAIRARCGAMTVIKKELDLILK